MDKTRKLIDKYKIEFKDFSYYLILLDKIEENVEKVPDISIESCKALAEGVSKTILKGLGKSYIEKGSGADTPNNLIRDALDELAGYTHIDVVFSQNICGFIKRLSDLRNERGDISHGKSVPKDVNSDRHLSEAVMEITDSIIYYILLAYFTTSLPKEEAVIEELRYEDNVEFNEFLDSENEIKGVVYSKALFDQDTVSYKEQLEEYMISMKEI